jgi:hypothetical protein
MMFFNHHYTHNIVTGIPNFGFKIPIFWLSRHWNFKRTIPNEIFGIKNRIWIPLMMGVPEIGTEYRNSQSSREKELNTSFGPGGLFVEP